VVRDDGRRGAAATADEECKRAGSELWGKGEGLAVSQNGGAIRKTPGVWSEGSTGHHKMRGGGLARKKGRPGESNGLSPEQGDELGLEVDRKRGFPKISRFRFIM